MKLYVDDKGIHYHTTRVNPNKTKRDIDEVLAKYGIFDIAWKFDLNNNNVVVSFQFSEQFRGHELMPIVRLKPPTIWNKKTRDKPESINMQVSLRVLFWYIKTSLEMAYAMQSERILAFLPHVVVNEEETVKDVVVPRIADLETFKKLPPPQEGSPTSDAQAVSLEPFLQKNNDRLLPIALLEEVEVQQFVRQLGRDPVEVTAT